MEALLGNTCCLALSRTRGREREREAANGLWPTLKEAGSISLAIHKSQQPIPLIAFLHQVSLLLANSAEKWDWIVEFWTDLLAHVMAPFHVILSLI